MHDRGPDLALDVVAHDRQAARLEPFAPGGVGGDEHRHAVDESAARRQRLLGVELRSLLRPDRQVGDQHVGARLRQLAGDVDHRRVRFRDVLPQVFAQAVQRRPALHGGAGRRGRGETMGVVGLGEDGRGDVQPHLGRADVERGRDLDIADVVAAEIDVHQPRHGLVAMGLGVIGHALNQ